MGRRNITLRGQVGNWLFQFSAAAKRLGADGLNLGVSKLEGERFRASDDVYRMLGAPFKATRRKLAAEPFAGYFQDPAAIPSRAECRRLFKAPGGGAVDVPVIHIRAGDYGRVFGGAVLATGERVREAAEALGARLQDCIAVTDDEMFVRGLGLPLRGVVQGTPCEAFRIMANARRLAAAPSSFSWWAGFLGNHDRVAIPLGYGPAELGFLDADPTSVHCNEALSWGDECVFAGAAPTLPGTAACLVCTGRYKELFAGFHESFARHFKDAVLYVFTDDTKAIGAFPGVRAIAANHGPWPDVVMRKHHILLRERALLSRHKNIVVLQANMRFVKGFRLPDTGGLVTCWHPWEGERRNLTCGGLLGGEAGALFKALEWTTAYIDRERAAGRTPQWHDETALNEYLAACDPPRTALPSWTMWPEQAPRLRRDCSPMLYTSRSFADISGCIFQHPRRYNVAPIP